jgi:3-oxoadipate enol-lactonase
VVEHVVCLSALGAPSALLGPLVPEGHGVVPYEHRGHAGTVAPTVPYRVEDLADDVLVALKEAGVSGGL